jgi:hypothetical protein
VGFKGWGSQGIYILYYGLGMRNGVCEPLTTLLAAFLLSLSFFSFFLFFFPSFFFFSFLVVSLEGVYLVTYLPPGETGVNLKILGLRWRGKREKKSNWLEKKKKKGKKGMEYNHQQPEEQTEVPSTGPRSTEGKQSLSCQTIINL